VYPKLIIEGDKMKKKKLNQFSWGVGGDKIPYFAKKYPFFQKKLPLRGKICPLGGCPLCPLNTTLSPYSIRDKALAKSVKKKVL